MNKSKMRKYPPIIVSAAIALALSTAAVAPIWAGWESQLSEAVEKAPQKNIETLQVGTLLAVQPTCLPETAEPEPTYESVVHSRDWDAEDSEMLLQIAMAEAEGESVEGKALVMLVVLNRVWSEQFPGTIEKVIFQPRQFSVTVDGGRYWTTEPDAGCYEALALVMSGWDESQGALYFESCEADSWHSRNLEYLFQEGGHKFYR